MTPTLFPIGSTRSSGPIYQRGLGLELLASCEDHEGFDGIMLGFHGSDFHFELTYCRYHLVQPTPTGEDLIVIYIPDAQEWMSLCDKMREVGFQPVEPLNPYWNVRGKSFKDHDGYRIVVQNAK